MFKRKLIIGAIVLLALLLTSCTSSGLDQNTLKEAIEFGKQHKFDFLSVSYIIKSPSCEENRQPYCAYYESLTMYTPFMYIAFAAANKAKNYEELSSTDIRDLSQDSLVITVGVMGRSDYEAEETSAVIKFDNQIIKAIKAPTYASVDDCTEFGCTYSAIQHYTFNGYSKFKDKKIKFVLIRQNGEKEYEIDMTKYK